MHRGASHHSAFMGNCSTISRMYLALSIQLVSGVNSRFHIIILHLVRIKRIRKQGELKILCITPVVETFSDRVAFKLLSNISDGAPLQKQPTALIISRC